MCGKPDECCSSVCLSIYLSISLSIYLSVCLSVYLSSYLSLCSINGAISSIRRVVLFVYVL
jgi:hypothetical protein